MKYWVVAFLLVMDGPALAADRAPLYWTYQYVLADSDEELSVAELVFDLPAHPEMCDQSMLDLLAEFFVNANLRDPSYERGMKEVFPILELGQAARYRTIVDQVGKKAALPSLRSLAAKYVKAHPENVPQYVAGTIDRAALRRQYAVDALNTHHSTDLATRLLMLPMDTTVDQTFARVGRPDVVLGHQRRMTDGFLVHIRTPFLFYYYRGIGRLTYRYNDKAGWVLRKVTINTMAFEPLMPYRDFAKELKLPDDETVDMTMLLSGDGPAAQIVVQKNHDRPAPAPTIIMDTAAEMLLARYRAPIEPEQRDAYGWICRLLSHKGGSRYIKVLETVAAGPDDKLARYAKLEIDPAPGANSAPYVPGSINLQELAAVYPVPYPPVVSR